MSDSPQIIWEKWRDPYGYDDLLELDQLVETPESSARFIDEQQTEDTEDINNTQQADASISNNILRNKIPFMFTPMGVIPYTENTAAGFIFNFWTGHTNFNLSKKICDIIEGTDGIETLDIFTRYRFRVAIGKCFIDSVVMRKINQNIYQHFLM